MVLGFSFDGDQIPATEGVLTNLTYTATNNLACLTNQVIALGDWAGGFYEILIGECAELDYGFGCTDSEACNYDSDADADDGSCFYDNAACNESITNNCEVAMSAQPSNV
jgi:hypothetical protein